MKYKKQIKLSNAPKCFVLVNERDHNLFSDRISGKITPGNDFWGQKRLTWVANMPW